ncbi:hypothetical protein MKZ38_008159 [Zalerion maritima]|uniref:CCHC-type domain-containing protein n=1 Tax=Zalerion maritima TaxID=339359 RepID=A0AAD5WTF1_9PEZI|nr:hypothetical protein MKZ38_008159 [Zalerion maritima]
MGSSWTPGPRLSEPQARYDTVEAGHFARKIIECNRKLREMATDMDAAHVSPEDKLQEYLIWLALNASATPMPNPGRTLINNWAQAVIPLSYSKDAIIGVVECEIDLLFAQKAAKGPIIAIKAKKEVRDRAVNKLALHRRETHWKSGTIGSLANLSISSTGGSGGLKIKTVLSPEWVFPVDGIVTPLVANDSVKTTSKDAEPPSYLWPRPSKDQSPSAAAATWPQSPEASLPSPRHQHQPTKGNLAIEDPKPVIYVCKRCERPGHCVEDCPTNLDSRYDRRPGHDYFCNICGKRDDHYLNLCPRNTQPSSLTVLRKQRDSRSYRGSIGRVDSYRPDSSYRPYGREQREQRDKDRKISTSLLYENDSADNEGGSYSTKRKLRIPLAEDKHGRLSPYDDDEGGQIPLAGPSTRAKRLRTRMPSPEADKASAIHQPAFSGGQASSPYLCGDAQNIGEYPVGNDNRLPTAMQVEAATNIFKAAVDADATKSRQACHEMRATSDLQQAMVDWRIEATSTQTTQKSVERQQPLDSIQALIESQGYPRPRRPRLTALNLWDQSTSWLKIPEPLGEAAEKSDEPTEKSDALMDDGSGSSSSSSNWLVDFMMKEVGENDAVAKMEDTAGEH